MNVGAVIEIAGGRLVDDPVSLIVAGLPTGRTMRVHAGCTDAEGTRFASWAEFLVGDDGSVDPSRQAPLSGSYEGADRYGLWWSMAAAGPSEFVSSLAPIATTVRVEVAGRVVAAAASWERIWLGPGVTAEPAGAGLSGTVFVPDRTPAPAVVVLGGSDGGRRWAEGVAALLASRGICALAIAYFGLPGLPATLGSVPLESVGAAISWLESSGLATGPGVAVAGASRGGELALLAGATYPGVSAVVGWAASGVVWAGLGARGRVGGPAWTHGGAAVPFAVPDEPPPEAGDGGAPIVLRSTFAAPLAGGRTDAAAIAVERINGPIMLVSGGDDQLWPAAQLAEAVVRRRAEHRAMAVRHLHYPSAGHLAGRPPGLPALPPAPPHPADGRRYDLGGTAAADAASGADAWPQVLAFLARRGR